MHLGNYDPAPRPAARCRILIVGIYDNVAPVTERERELTDYAASDFDLETYKQDAGVSGVHGTLLHQTAKEVLNHRWRQPTLSLHGIEGAFSGSGTQYVVSSMV